MKKLFCLLFLACGCSSTDYSETDYDQLAQLHKQVYADPMMTVTIKKSFVAKDRYEVLLLDSLRKKDRSQDGFQQQLDAPPLIQLKAGRVVKIVKQGKNNSVVALLDKGHSQRLFYISNSSLAHYTTL